MFAESVLFSWFCICRICFIYSDSSSTYLQSSCAAADARVRIFGSLPSWYARILASLVAWYARIYIHLT